jgi:hypothetical protein
MANNQEFGSGRLTQKERAVLYAAYRILDARYDQYVPLEKIRQKMVGRAQYKIKKPLKSLVAMGLLQGNPTRSRIFSRFVSCLSN